MSSIIKNLLGNPAKIDELPLELRAILAEMRDERTKFQSLAARVQNFTEPIAEAEARISGFGAKVKGLEARLSEFEQVATRLRELAGEAEELNKVHRRTETHVAHTAEDAERIRSQMEEIAHKADIALCLKDDLSAFLAMKDPFEQVRGEAEILTGTVKGLFSEVGSVRTLYEEFRDRQERATAQLSAFEQQRAGLFRSLEDKDRRVTELEGSLSHLSELATGVRDTKQELGTLKALADYVAQKVATLEQQRTAIEQTIDRAETLDGFMQQVNAGLEKQQEQARILTDFQARLTEVRRVHVSVTERSDEITARQREIDEQQEATARDLATLREETRKSIDRFEFEKKGVDAVSQRVVDLRSSLSDFEERFRTLNDSSQAVAALQSQTGSLATQLGSLRADIVGLEDEARKAHALRREMANLEEVVTEARERLGRVEEVRPALEGALQDFESLSRSHALVKDSLEQVQLAHSEIARMQENQSETRSWLTSVQQSVSELRDQVVALDKMRPTVDFAQKQVLRVNESLSAIEERRDFVRDMHKRLSDLAGLGSTLDERTQGLVSRADAAERQFVSLSSQAEETERLARTISGVVSSVEQAERGVTNVGKAVASVEERFGHIEGLAERMRTLRQEVEQRQRALDEGAKDLERASALRQEAAAAAHELDARVKSLSGALASAEGQAARLTSVASELEGRGTALKFIEKRIGDFEARLADWELAEQKIDNSLEQISGRQATVDALHAEIDRLSSTAERTASDVRRITETQKEVAEARTILDAVFDRLREVESTADTLDDRQRQMSQAEVRLARAEALLIDIRSSLETLQGQKVIVDHAVEKAGSLKFLLKQSEALIETLREERQVTGRLRTALSALREENGQQEAESESTIANVG